MLLFPLKKSRDIDDAIERPIDIYDVRNEAGAVDSDVRCNPVDSIGPSTESRVSHSEPPPFARFPRDKDGSARRNIEPFSDAGGCTSRRNSGAPLATLFVSPYHRRNSAFAPDAAPLASAFDRRSVWRSIRDGRE